MGPGLPGIGVTSIFYVLIGIFAPIREVALTMQRGSSRPRWRLVGRQFVIALGTAMSVTAFYLAIEIAMQSRWLPDTRTKLPGAVPAWAYGLVVLVALLLSLALYARICATSVPNDPHSVARAHRHNVSDQLGVIAGVSDHLSYLPKGRYLSPVQRLPLRPCRSMRSADLEIHLSQTDDLGRHLKFGRHASGLT
jgi:hypothetical protein